MSATGEGTHFPLNICSPPYKQCLFWLQAATQVRRSREQERTYEALPKLDDAVVLQAFEDLNLPYYLAQLQGRVRIDPSELLRLHLDGGARPLSLEQEHGFCSTLRNPTAWRARVAQCVLARRTAHLRGHTSGQDVAPYAPLCAVHFPRLAPRVSCYPCSPISSLCS